MIRRQARKLLEYLRILRKKLIEHGEVSITVRGVYNAVARHDNGKRFWDGVAKNGVTNIGRDEHLNIMFHASTQVTVWYFGLIDNAAFSALAAGDTMGSHAGWAESTAYDEATRVAWAEGAASSNIMTNSSPSVFTCSTNGTVINGAFLTSVNTKAGTTGTLWSTGSFSSTASLNDNDTLSLTYSLTEA